MEASARMFFQDRDPYAILDVSPTADQAAIKAAYRRLARRYHPDLATSSEARRRMIEINRAWEILSDPAKRGQHHRRRRESASPPMPQAPSPQAAPSSHPAWMSRHAAERRPAAGWAAGAKGRPPGNPSGSVLDFGIYLGWSVGEIARVDPLYLDWLAARPEGRRYADEIATLRGRPSPEPSRRWAIR